MQGVGEGKDSEGSDWIIRVLEEEDNRPLWVSVWGGANTLAQALFRIQHSRSAAEAKRLMDKLRVYAISDQDDSGIWIRNHFPGLFYIVSPGGYRKATWTGITTVVPGIDNTTISNKWLAENIQQGHGPLGALYPDVAYGMEGDTPSWLSLIPNGLNVPAHPEWGGWGGRYELYKPALENLDVNGFNGGVPIEPETRPSWTNAIDNYKPFVYNAYGRAVRIDTLSFHDNKVTLWRWRDDFQNDFAARIEWTYAPYRQTYHPPVPALGHPDEITIRAGEKFNLDATGTTDPDGDSMSYCWFQYPETRTLTVAIPFATAENLYKVALMAPEVKRAETTQFILKVTDKGKPALTRYKRVIIHILPR